MAAGNPHPTNLKCSEEPYQIVYFTRRHKNNDEGKYRERDGIFGEKQVGVKYKKI